MTDLMTPDAPGGGDPNGGRLVDEPVDEALSKRYLAYALSTITSRALPDVRDGLKPVQRRILYAMRELRLDPAGGFKKCAKIVGEVMGNLHPHGDDAIYQALVRLAQTFAQRVPLVDGQGNFGNVDGDNAAAMRYTEARLTKAAEALLAGLDEDAVDFRATYDGEDDEPVVLPGAFPNLLVNGTSGIAVGMATSVPPHNPGEMITAARRLIAEPDAGVTDLLGDAPGPDFPTGGVIVDDAATITEAYETGRGAFRTRARWSVETGTRGAFQVVVTEIPYQVQKSKLVERLAELIDAKKAPLLADVRDESAEDVRLVLEPRSRAVDPDVLMESLFRQCDLEVRVPLNLNVLDARGVPGVMGLKGCLRAFLDHRRDVLQRRTRHRLAAIADRLEVLAAYLIAYLNIDEVIRIIREEDDPKAEFIARFDLSERQAEAILNMRLRALRKLEEIAIREEDDRLRAEQAELQALLGDTPAQWTKIDAELAEAADLFAKDETLGPRRTGFAKAPTVDMDAAAAMVPREPVTVVLSQLGWIRALKGRVEDVSELKFKDGDGPAFALPCETTDKLLIAASDGRVFTLDAAAAPGGRGHGEPLRLHVDLSDGADVIALVLAKPDEKRLIASDAGRGFVVAMKDVIAQTRAGKQVLNLDAGERAAVFTPSAGDRVAVVGENRKLLIFPLADLPEMGRGKGVRLQNYAKGGLLDAATFASHEGFGWTDAAGRRFALEEWRDWDAKRAAAGKPAPKGFPRSGKFAP